MVKLNGRAKGFTLIELLLAMSLLLLIMYSGYYAYSLYSNSWDKRAQLFWQNTQDSLAFDSINRVYGSVAPYIVISDKEQPAIYFHGNHQRMIFVTGSPIFSKSSGIVEIAVENTNQGKSQLVYREAPFEQLLLLHQSDEIFWQHQVVLINNLENVSFEYYGWAGYDQVLENIARDQNAKDGQPVSIIPPNWYGDHQLQNQRVLPIKVRINFQSVNTSRTSLELKLPENAHLNLVHYLREDA